jgi:hypothetical protein
MFFSEEKNQKTFDSALVRRSRPWPASLRWRRYEGLLLLFFRKEDLSLAFEATPFRFRHTPAIALAAF